MKPKAFSRWRHALFASATSIIGCSVASAAPARPVNVIVILADDAGYADFGFQGSKTFQTPRLDALAKESATYTAAYATTPFCSPSRAGLLTGRYPQRFGYEFNLTHTAQQGVDARFMGLAVEEETIGTLFKAAGYATLAIGKWHVGDQPQFHPNNRGFDHFYGFTGGNSRYLPSRIKPGSIERNGIPASPDAYLTDAFAQEAAQLIERNRDRPFMLYLAFNAVHTPMDARQEDEARFSTIKDPQRRRLAAMTWAMDRAIGHVLDTLERLDLDENTIVVFTNDNGGDRVGLDASNAPLRGTKGTLLEGGIRVPLLVRYPGGAHAGTTNPQPVSLMDILPTTLALAGIAAPDNLDGTSLLSDPAKLAARPLYWRYDNMAGVRQGQWKMLRYPDRPPELHDLAKDVGERRDLASRKPAQVRSMMQALFAWEADIEHPRWHTGSFWSQEDVRRYSDSHVLRAIAASKAELPPASE